MEAAAGALSRRQGVNKNIHENFAGRHSALGYVVACLTAIAWFGALELILLILLTFKRWRGIYFWSLLVASTAILPYMLGFLLYFFQLTENNYVSMTFVTIGWWPMVTGQSVVLWSRLHLVSTRPRIIRRLKWLIIIDALVFHTPTTICTFLSQGPPTATGGGTPSEQTAYKVIEKIQMTAFCLQEFTISTIYLIETSRLLKATCFEKRKKKVMYRLLAVNAVIIISDIALLALEYGNFYTLETTIKGVLYTLKLRMEFAVLNELISATQERRRPILAASVEMVQGDCAKKKAIIGCFLDISAGRKAANDGQNECNPAECPPLVAAAPRYPMDGYHAYKRAEAELSVPLDPNDPDPYPMRATRAYDFANKSI